MSHSLTAAAAIRCGLQSIPLSTLSGDSSPVSLELGPDCHHLLWSFLASSGPPLRMRRLAMPFPVPTHYLVSCLRPPCLSLICVWAQHCWLCRAILGCGREQECIFFLAQVNELPSSTVHRDNLEAEESHQRRPSTAPRETKRTRRKQTATSLHNKYDGYEELLTVKPDPAFVEPKGTGLTCWD